MKKKVILRNIFGRIGNYTIPYKNEAAEGVTNVHEALDYIFENGSGSSIIKGTSIGDFETQMAEMFDMTTPEGLNQFYEYMEDKFIFNEDDGKYYYWDNDWKPLIYEPPVCQIEDYTERPNDTTDTGSNVNINDPNYATQGATCIKISPDWYYLFGTRTDNLAIMPRLRSDSIAYSYMGRFTVALDQNDAFNFSIKVPTDGIGGLIDDQSTFSFHVPDNISKFEDGHTYEFNILYDVCVITDITYTTSDFSNVPVSPAQSENP